MSEFGIHTPLVSNKLNSFARIQIQTLLLSLTLKFEQLTILAINLYLLSHFLRENKKFRTHRSRKYRKLMHVEASTQITNPFAKAKNKTLQNK
jgi:hypothetical protein